MQYVPGTCVFVLYCVFFTLHLYQSSGWCWALFLILVISILFVCLFICVGSNANMTMCALDTCNSSERDTNAVVNVLLQFNSFHHSFFILLCSILYFFTSFPVSVVCHITIQNVPQDGWFQRFSSPKTQVFPTYNKWNLAMQVVLVLFAQHFRYPSIYPQCMGTSDNLQTSLSAVSLELFSSEEMVPLTTGGAFMNIKWCCCCFEEIFLAIWEMHILIFLQRNDRWDYWYHSWVFPLNLESSNG